MRLESQDKPPVEHATAKQIKSTIARLKSYGRCSYAALIDEDENYVQVAGGRVTCMIERRDAINRRHFRAFQDKRSDVFEDGTMLAFGGGSIKLFSNEWFNSIDVEEVFMSFFEKREFPDKIKWRDITEMFDEGG